MAEQMTTIYHQIALLCKVNRSVWGALESTFFKATVQLHENSLAQGTNVNAFFCNCQKS